MDKCLKYYKPRNCSLRPDSNDGNNETKLNISSRKGNRIHTTNDEK